MVRLRWLAWSISLASCGAPASAPNTVQSVAAEDVVWTDVVNATASGNSVTKSGGVPQAADAGAITVQQIASGDGFFEFTAGDTQPFRYAGLAHQHTGTTGAEIDFAFRLQSGRADIYEAGAWRADNTVAAGDVLRVSIEGGHANYYKNGISIYVGSGALAYPLFGATSLIDPNAGVTHARIAGGVAALSVSGVAAQPSDQGATVTWSTSGAASSQVEVGLTSAYGQLAGDAADSVLAHQVALTGLTPATTYHYRVHSTSAAGEVALSPDQTFTTTAAAPAANRHRFCGWTLATGYAPEDSDPGFLAFAANADQFDAVHPIWWHLSTDGVSLVRVYGEGTHTILDHTTYAGKRTLIIPTISAVDNNEPALIDQMLNSPTLRAQHIANIRALITSHQYDGIDLDYEHLPDADRAAFSTFAQELSQQLHSDGKTLSFAVQALTRASTVWDYDALSQSADQLHLMGYDYHYLGSHPGPITPLGWAKDVGSYIATIAGGARSQKFIFGLANYALAGPDSGTTGWTGTSMDAINAAGGVYSSVTDHMTTCPYVDPSHPVASGLAPNATTSHGHTFFEDLASMEEKVAAAQAANLGGITYFTIGGEPDRPGTKTFFQMIRGYFPQ